MRPLEVILFLALFSLLIPFPDKLRRLALFGLGAFTDSVLVAHLLFEGYRWQMAPAYAL